MKLEHITGMQTGCTMGLDKEGCEYLVVRLKGTYSLPANGRPPVLLPEQLPLVEADQFSGEPGLSAPVYESDFAPVKPRCDILLNGGAYAPDLDLTTHNHGSPPGNSPPWPYIDAIAMDVEGHPCQAMAKDIKDNCQDSRDYGNNCCNARKCLLMSNEPNKCCNPMVNK